MQFLGFYLNFNKLNILGTHVPEKVATFTKMVNYLRFQGRIGGNMPIDVQRKLYLVAIRAAFTYGMAVVPMRQSHYNQIDEVQRSFLRTIIGCGHGANSMSIRMLLGVPKLSDFVIKQKLLHYHRVMMVRADAATNALADHQAANYRELFHQYQLNGHSLDGLKDQFMFDTADWIRCIDRWKLPDIYKDPEWLPMSESEWKRIVDRRWNEIYRSDLAEFLNTNGRIMSLVFGVREMERKHMRRPYRGLIEEMKFLYSHDISTNNISKSIRVLINNTKLNYFERVPIPGNRGALAVGIRGRRCPLCHRHRGKYAN